MNDGGCAGCFQSARGLSEQLIEIRAKAKAHAKQKGETVAIFREGFEIKFIAARIAVSENLPVMEFISGHQ